MNALRDFRLRWTRLFTLLLGGIVMAGAGAMLFASSGLYSVAASEGHLAIVDKFLRFGMRSSVQTQARNIKAPELSDPDMIRLGAGHYFSGCMPCHGAPGHAGNAVFQNSLPAPPNLRAARDAWRDREMFWLVKHGLKYTGMPGWSARDRNDEQWAVVAFLKRLPELGKGEYEALALGGWSLDRVANDEPSKTFGADIAQCARCHGDTQGNPASALVPKLAGQSETYLLQALNDYAAGSRQSGIMQPIASTLSAEQRARYAQYYANDKPKSAALKSSGAGTGAGARLAAEGDAARAIPACDSCHGADRHHSYPRLEGQQAKYLAAQLKLWRSGLPRTGPLAAIMAPMAAKLSDAEIDALAAHYAAASESGAP